MESVVPMGIFMENLPFEFVDTPVVVPNMITEAPDIGPSVSLTVPVMITIGGVTCAFTFDSPKSISTRTKQK